MGSGFLRDLPKLRKGRKTLRQSSWDRTGGNKDNITIPPHSAATLATIDGAGLITHLWFTIMSPDRLHLRNLILKIYWDGEEEPSVLAPVGDFFGNGNCIPKKHYSLLLSCGPRSGKGMNAYFPMPFSKGARVEIENMGDLPALAFYYYVDYELHESPPEDMGRFHACFRREAPCEAVSYKDEPSKFGFKGHNLTGDENYLILDAKGQGHYIGCMLYVHNKKGAWYGEGDDMIFIDGEGFPPSLHGTGTEDYFGTAWSPAEEFHGPYFGQPLAQKKDWTGFSHMYRFHIMDPVIFQKSIRVTIEHGHANDRGDDYSSVAYWYQTEPHAELPDISDPAVRIPPYSEPLMKAVEEANKISMSMLEGLDISDPKAMLTFGRLFVFNDLLDRAFYENDIGKVKKLISDMRP